MAIRYRITDRCFVCFEPYFHSKTEISYWRDCNNLNCSLETVRVIHNKASTEFRERSYWRKWVVGTVYTAKEVMDSSI